MSKLRDLEKLLTHLENRTDRTDKSPFRQFCQSAPLDMQEVFSSGGSRMDRPGRATTGRGVREGEKQRKFHAHLENPTDKTDTNGADASDPTRCAHCGEGERSGSMIVPFGTEATGHTWLHSECWRAWYTKRCAAGAGEAR
jgi:hypothetical protein